jgi:hypothetical protein
MSQNFEKQNRHIKSTGEHEPETRLKIDITDNILKHSVGSGLGSTNCKKTGVNNYIQAGASLK